MIIEIIPIDSVSSDPANARRHPERNFLQIKASLKRFGQQKPIVIDKKNVVRAGNGTLAAALALGWKEIKCVRSELADGELTAYGIVDNRTAELAEWDREILDGFLADESLGDLGFDDKNVTRFLDDSPAADKENRGAETIDEKWLVVVTCQDEADQLAFLEEMGRAGRQCKAVSGW